MTGTGLALREVGVVFGAVRAVWGVSLEVARGEILACLGPSGCGKSTLLRAVAGLEPLACGQVSWDGGDLSGVEVHRRGFGLVFQEGQLFGHFDVARNIDYGLRAAGAARPARRERVAELLGLVGLSGCERREVGTLSGGEQQRVALGRALAPRPRMLLLDEPFSSLDTELRRRLAADVRRILRAEGATAIIVTHDQDEAFAVADRIAVMAEGRLEDIGAPGRLWSWPASQQAARTLGCRWFASGQLSSAPKPMLLTPWGAVNLPLGCPAGAQFEPDAVVGLRPGVPGVEDVVIGLRPGAIAVPAARAAARLQSGEMRALVSLPSLGPVEVRVDLALDDNAPFVIDHSRLAIIRTAQAGAR